MGRRITIISALTIASGVLVWLALSAFEDKPFRYPEGRWQVGQLRYIAGLPVLEVAGTPQDIGAQVARLGAMPASRLRQYPRDLFFAAWPRFVAREWKEKAWRETLAVGERLLANIPERHRQEYQALRDNLPEDWHEGLLAGNTLFDIKRLVHCSAVIVQADRGMAKTAENANLLFGRNLDFPTLGYLHRYSLVLIYKPKGHYAFVAVGFPGMVGVLSGMNEHGLCVAILEVYESGDGSPSFDPRGVPYAIVLRRILEECRTLAEAERLVKSVPRTCYYNLAICDTRTGGVLEISPRQVSFRGLEQGICACTNCFQTPALAAVGGKNWYRSRERLQVLLALREEANVGVAQMHQALHRAHLGAVTLQTMIFEPQALRLHLAMGKCPASALPLVCLDLLPLLKPDPLSPTESR
ncbi:hypothetical protein HRbin36_02301 [bacterium HR36]|uniref:Choloylglycine hydrolase n=1 Tax=uncultured Planctomycetota bacterium TaxID=120965 RepID=H5SCT4_9BACT|nr:choloylglycine hydrolase [uncultured Planctomycetota bacterium]GBD37171.1 hypothetical protein HRbin36_02301 [bacterium HR36]